jgi:PAS domain S-box-containing protein
MAAMFPNLLANNPNRSLSGHPFESEVAANRSREGGSKSFMVSYAYLLDERNRTPVLLASGILLIAIAVVDWKTEPYFSLSFLYLFPIMLAARFLPRWVTVFLGLFCAVLSQIFSPLEPSDAPIRFGFEALALSGCGLFIAELVRNRWLMLCNQRLTLDAEERLRVLVETSPAAIVTVDERGFIERANLAATELIAPRDGVLVGQPIAAFLPELHHALRKEEGPQLRASMQCPAHRGNGDVFLAGVWFSTYKEGSAPRLAAIIADVTEDRHPATLNATPGNAGDRLPLHGRELEVLRLVVQGLTNKEIAQRMEISESVVKNILQQLFAKTEVRTRSQLVRVALQRYCDLL